jgi:C-terminal processing protease CtpA/Prc
VFGAVACGAAAEPPAPAPAPEGVHAPAPPDPRAPRPLAHPWCAALAPGPRGTAPVPVALSAAHAMVRFFGAEASHAEADRALVAALAADDAASPDLDAYAAALAGACAADADERALAPVRIDVRDGVAIVRPGTGATALPAGTRAVVIDLRDLPDAVELRDALRAAVGPALARDVAGGRARVRKHVGHFDEYYSRGLYESQVVDVERAPIRASGAADLPLAFVIGDRTPPSALAIAGTLRLARRAWLFGREVRAEIAESRWIGVGNAGIATRTQDLVHGAARWPDAIPADREAVDAFADLASLGEPAAVASGEATRPALADLADFRKVSPSALGPGVLRAALVVAHGTLKQFYPYYGTVLDESDARLVDTLAHARDASRDRRTARDLLRRFTSVSRDGHGWVIDQASAQKYLPLAFQRVGAEAVVRDTTLANVSRGDALVSVNGTPAAEWLAREMSRSYGATDGFLFTTAVQELQSPAGALQLGLRDASGASRVETVTPTRSGGVLPYAISARRHGSLADLGAPDVHYINADGQFAGGDQAVRDALSAAQSARGLVVDMRGHPANGGAQWNPYELVQRLATRSYPSPRYMIPVFVGPDLRDETHPYQQTFVPLDGPSFGGRVVLLTHPVAVSFAEDFSMLLASARPITVVGERTAGTTGSITGAQLPGAFAAVFTGMEARWPDGRVFHGEGVVPDVVAQPTQADLREGKDRALLEAIRVLSQ